MKFRLSINYDPKDGHKGAEGGWGGMFLPRDILAMMVKARGNI